MKGHCAGRAIAADHQCPRVVAEQRPRDAAEMREGRGNAFPPVILPLVEKGFDKQTPGIAQDGDVQKDAHPGAGNADALLSEGRSEARRRADFPCARSPDRPPDARAEYPPRPFDGPNADLNTLLGQQLLDDHCIPARGAFIEGAHLTPGLLGQLPRRWPNLDPGLDGCAQIAF
jgi:hypothetical protein